MNDICNVPFIGKIISSNFNIPDSIIDVYFSLVPQPDQKDLDEKEKKICGHKAHRFYHPYCFNVHGAFPLNSAWEMLVYKINSPDFPKYTHESIEIPLQEYAKGFQIGFDSFIDEISKFQIVKTPDTISEKVMDFLSNPFVSRGEFSEAHGEGRMLFDNWYNDGIEAGRYYKAWLVIFENHRIFEPYFNNFKLPPPPPTLTFSTFAEAFKEVSDWVNIKNQLIEKGYLSEAGKWNDFASGYKTTAAGLIKWLAANGYCQKVKFTELEIQSFCINDFGFDGISSSTIKHASPELPLKLALPPKKLCLTV